MNAFLQLLQQSHIICRACTYWALLWKALGCMLLFAPDLRIATSNRWQPSKIPREASDAIQRSERIRHQRFGRNWVFNQPPDFDVALTLYIYIYNSFNKRYMYKYKYTYSNTVYTLYKYTYNWSGYIFKTFHQSPNWTKWGVDLGVFWKEHETCSLHPGSYGFYISHFEQPGVFSWTNPYCHLRVEGACWAMIFSGP